MVMCMPFQTLKRIVLAKMNTQKGTFPEFRGTQMRICVLAPGVLGLDGGRPKTFCYLPILILPLPRRLTHYGIYSWSL